LWKKLIKLEQERDVVWIKVKGHSGDKYNELADKLAVAAIPKKKNNGDKCSSDKINLELSKECYLLLLDILEQNSKNNIEIRNLYNEVKQNLQS